MRSGRATIVAQSTPVGVGAIGIVRLSGPEAQNLAARLVSPLPPPGRAELRLVRDEDGQPIDRGLVMVFCAPRSYTGEDLVEFHLHGNPLLLARLLEALVTLGSRPAEPGEFTRRAFINGKLDLAQAEAVADLIEARDRAAARAALRSLEGDFSRCVRDLDALLREGRVYAEAELDFSDQDVDEGLATELERTLTAAQAQLEHLCRNGRRGESLRTEPRVLLLGRPNVGKSSLFNRLVGREQAIVTPVAGTTRDLLEAEVLWGEFRVCLCDGAGLRTTNEPIEREGVARVWREVDRADLLVYVLDASVGWTEEDREQYERLERTRRLAVANKSDLGGTIGEGGDGSVLAVSALRGEGLETLVVTLRARLARDPLVAGEEGVYLARRRHLTALDEAAEHLAKACALLKKEGEADLLAEEIRWAQKALGQILGDDADHQLLDDVFRRFCIGK